ncbi:DASS family sodium-coupled anion symporter [Qipengyuania sp. S6317L1]|uniref:SLC13 family permease n=1 Tax=Qipengyuania sp. S6317L1 TaxID=2926410 RepID=UPI001FF16FC5|nr:DASS family sodium-coupled anion symporter [Qipengyuania sp. S6317L1]MCK0098342.1 DASS family sodium-coupled anion symporter [Qipengyuania sp. S6317L1]
MSAQKIGLFLGPLAFAITIFAPAPSGMSGEAWLVAGLVAWMAAWWMTEAVPLSVTALLPFVCLPLFGVMTARETAGAYYAPILFLLLGGAFIALAIERTGLHRRLSLAILKAIGSEGGQVRLLLAFMISAAILSGLISNTSTTLIMMPMALAVLAGGAARQSADGRAEFPAETSGIYGALPMGIAFAATIGGLGTIVGSPTNGIAVQLLDDMIGLRISFADWMIMGVPVVLIGVPLACFIVARVQRVDAHPFDVAAARTAIDDHAPWSPAERRLVPIIAITFLLWMSQRWVAPFLPPNSWTDGTIAVLAALTLFILPDGTNEGGRTRPLLSWDEANRAPWGVILMFGGGLALAAGMQASGLADWLGQSLLPLEAMPLFIIALAVVAMVVLVTEFASNVATASAIIPVVASLAAGLGLGEAAILIAMPAALAASWGFILPAGTGPNAIAWGTGRLRIEKLVRAGLVLDLLGIFLIVAIVWVMSTLL